MHAPKVETRSEKGFSFCLTVHVNGRKCYTNISLFIWEIGMAEHALNLEKAAVAGYSAQFAFFSIQIHPRG